MSMTSFTPSAESQTAIRYFRARGIATRSLINTALIQLYQHATNAGKSKYLSEIISNAKRDTAESKKKRADKISDYHQGLRK